MSLFTSALRSAGILSSQNPQQFGEVLREERGPLSVPIARFWEKIGNLGQRTVDPQNLPVARPRYQFTLLLERLRKTVERVTLLQNLNNPPVFEGQPLTLEQLVGEDPERRALLEKICPGVLTTSPLKQRDLIRQALEYQENRLDHLLQQMIRWTFLQPDWQNLSQAQVFDMLEEVKGALTSKIKWISDPYIPFLKIAIAERAIWHVRSEKDVGEASFFFLFENLKAEHDMIFGKVQEMYYNTFLGADHPKVQENLRNQNDFCKIGPQDIKDRIVELQLDAVARYLAPSPELQQDSYQLLLQIYKDPNAITEMNPQETQLYSQLVQNWTHFADSELKMIPLEYFITHNPQNASSNPSIASDLVTYQAITDQLRILKENSAEQEVVFLKGSFQKLETHKLEIVRLQQVHKELTAQKMELERKLANYPQRLEESATNLQIEIWKLQAEIRTANRVMRFFLEGSHQRKATSLTTTIAQRSRELVDQARHDQTTTAIRQVVVDIALERAHVVKTTDELAQGRAQFREIFQVNVRKLKTDQQALASKVYYLTPQQLDTLMKVNDNQ